MVTTRPSAVQFRMDGSVLESRGRKLLASAEDPNDFGVNKGLANLPYLQKLGRQINRRLLEVERVSHNSGLSGDRIQRVAQPTVTENDEKAPALSSANPASWHCSWP